jgi:hypothetical protein
MTSAGDAALAVSALRYHLRIVRGEQLVLPGGLWALFALMLLLFANDSARQFDVAVAYLGMILPLGAGILSASAIVDDPALELQFAAPRPAWRLLLERVALVLAITGIAAMAFQILSAVAGVSLAGLGGLGRRQLAWLIPCAALCGLSSASTLVMRHSTGGALFVGLVWIIQVLIREGVSATRWGRYLYLFMGARQPAHPDLVANQACLAALAAGLTFVGATLLRRQERYL